MIKRQRRWMIGSLATLFALLLAVKSVLVPWWHRSCGNYPVAFYGRVVDDKGKPVQGVAITFDGMYSTRPNMRFDVGTTENHWERTVATDQNGDFALKGVYAYYVRGQSGTKDGIGIGLVAIGVPAQDDPLAGVSLDDLSSAAKLPDSPAKRVIYKLSPLK